MNIAQLRHYDIANGTGIRTTIFLSGCTLHCEGCFNLEYQDFNYGKPYEDMREELESYLSDEKTNGVSILGGEPLDQDLEALEELLYTIKCRHKKSIWMWTGYKFENIPEKKLSIIFKYVDILVDGEFDIDKRNLKLKFKGSENQRVIDIKETIENNEIMLLKEKE